MHSFVLTSESVTAGHPDKICDQISDAVVDACLAQDHPTGCVAECALASGIAFLSLRHGGPPEFDPAALARRVLADCGYPDAGRDGRTTVILDRVLDPALGGPVAAAAARARHMTTVFGHACDHGAARLPLPIEAAHRLSARLGAAAAGTGWLSPDAQVQVAVRFEARRPVALAGIAVTVATGPEAPDDAALADWLAAQVLDPGLAGLAPARDGATRLAVHRMAGPGGPGAHAGLTGRKGADDSYGGFVRQGSAALSGKDPSRIDRVAAYAARQAAVSVVAAGLARDCEVQLSYVAGDAGPVSLETDSFGSGAVPDAEITAILARAIDFRIGATVERLGLWDLPRRRGGRFYRDLAAQGHFGRLDLAAPWETPLPLG